MIQYVDKIFQDYNSILSTSHSIQMALHISDTSKLIIQGHP